MWLPFLAEFFRRWATGELDVEHDGVIEMGEKPQASGDGLLGKARRMADDALAYARSDEAKGKLAEVKKKAVVVGGAASTGAKDLAMKAGRAAAQAKGKVQEIATSERAGEIRSGAEGLWGRSRSITVRGIPWMESPIAVGVLMVFVCPLGLYLLWKNPAWSKTKKTAWTGVWAGLMVLGVVALRQDERTTATANADAGLAPSKPVKTSERSSGPSPNRASAVTKIADLAKADATDLTPGNVLAVMETMASQVEPFDTRTIDYTHGPKGEAIISRPGRDPQTSKKTIDSGYLAADGQFRLHGLRTSWYGSATENAQRRRFQEIYYFDDQPHGLVRNWFETGDKQSELMMRLGKRHGLAISYFEEGNVGSASLWNNGQEDGPRCEWYVSGRIKSLMNYERGAASGTSKAWYPSGNLWYEENYVGGKQHGRKVENWKNGRSDETEWNHGKIVYVPGKSNVRSFFLKLRETATDARGADGGTYAFERQEQFLRVFGRPTSGLPLTKNDPDFKTLWIYKCRDASVKMTVSNSLWFILEGVDTIENLN